MSLEPIGLSDYASLQAASRYMRIIYASKLVLLAIVIPVVIFALLEAVRTISGTELLDLRTSPLLVGAAKGSFYFVIALVFLLVIAIYIPLLGPLFAAPLLAFLGYVALLTIGLLVDVLVVTPRIFIGSMLDSVLLPAPETPDEGLFTRKGNVSVLLLILCVAVVTTAVWHPLYSNWTARGREYFQEQEALRLRVRKEWEDLRKVIDAIYYARTLDDAIWTSQSVYNLKFDNLKQYDGYRYAQTKSSLQDAVNYLHECRDRGETRPEQWRPGFRKELHGLPMSDYEPPSYTETQPTLPPDTSPSPARKAPQSTANQTQQPPEATQSKSPPQESTPKQAPDSPRIAANPVEQPTAPPPSAEEPDSHDPMPPFQKGTTWVGMSLVVSDGGINPRSNDGAKLRVELTITRHNADHFEGIVRHPWAVDASGNRVRWGATASARGTYRDGQITIRSTPTYVPLGTVLFPGTWSGTISEGVFTGQFHGPNGSLGEFTLQKRASTHQRQ